MNYLAIDTSGTHLTVTVKYKQKQYSFFNESCGLQHSILLNKKIEEVLNQANATLNDMDFFACNIGAGSFTGIRIGISTIKAFSYALNKPVLAVTSFDCLAYNTDRNNVLAVVDAKNDNYYIASYVNGKMQKCEFVNLDAIIKDYSNYKIAFNGHIDGLNTEKCDILQGLINAVEDNYDKINNDREILIPLYIRKSQAEENR